MEDIGEQLGIELEERCEIFVVVGVCVGLDVLEGGWRDG
jgi:hypothetical protein